VDSVIAYLPADTCNTYLKPTGIKEILQAGNDFIIYPNPAQNNFTVEGTLAANAELEVYNINGQQVYHRRVLKGSLHEQVNTGEWGSGIFMLRISDPALRDITTKKVVVIKE
jgi:hypothetical protein